MPKLIFASTTDGTILGTEHYAWGENVGWVNFAAQNGNVHVTDTALTGYIWDSIYGWINLNPPTAGVKNDDQGNLSGYAWSAGTGFINFTGVIINSSGKFTGQAQGTIFGRLNFDCSICNVVTDYRPASTISGRRHVNPPITDEISVTDSGSSTSNIFVPPFIPITPIIVIPVASGTISIPESVIAEINIQNKVISTEVSPAVTPSAIVRQPTEFEILLANFPAFKQILVKLGVNFSKETEAIKKITNVNFTLPTFLSNSLSLINILGIHLPSFITNPLSPKLSTQNIGAGKLLQSGLSSNNINNFNGVPLSPTLPTQNIGAGKLLQSGLSSNDINNFKGMPLANLPVEIAKGVPEEVLFTRAGNANIDIPINLKVDQNGQLNKSIEISSNEKITLIIKPKQDKKVDAITGYLVFKSNFSLKNVEPLSVKQSIFSNLVNTAYAEGISNLPAVIPEASVEDMMVLMSFKFTDTNNDGLYVANISTPNVEGNYEIVTAINYQGEKTPKVLRLITVIDPEGYVYESAGINETRIRNATVTMLKLNESTKKYENWNAKDFAQKNPQITNQTGQYSYLVPEGTYQLKVEAKGYVIYYSKIFTAEEGDSLHENIELKKTQLNLLDYWNLFWSFFNW